jgi:hypothetical protein
MLNANNEVLAQLKFDKEINIESASKWSEEDIKAMISTYKKTMSVAQEIGNNSLYLIAREKLSQLQLADKVKNKSSKRENAKVEMETI